MIFFVVLLLRLLLYDGVNVELAFCVLADIGCSLLCGAAGVACYVVDLFSLGCWHTYSVEGMIAYCGSLLALLCVFCIVLSFFVRVVLGCNGETGQLFFYFVGAGRGRVGGSVEIDSTAIINIALRDC